MASPAQIAANQANAALSTGPKTVEGKAAASHNAVSHGATSKQTVLAWESQSQFDSLAADTRAHYQPRGHHESALTDLVAFTFWRYNRLLRLEAEFMSAVDHDGANPEAAVAALFADPAGAKKLSLVLRYLANASREWRGAVTELRRVQKENRAVAEDPFALNPEQEACDDAIAESAGPAPCQAAPAHVNRAERRALDLARRNAEKRARCALPVPSLHPPIGFDSYLTPSAA